MFFTTGTLHARLFPSLLWKMDAPEIYLTFDDGPHTHATPAVLDVLKRHDVSATFFLSGCNIEGREPIVRDIARAGHTIGIHAYSHTRMLVVSKKRTASEIQKTSRMISEITGVAPKWFRPPFGFFSWNTIAAAREAGCAIAMWTVMPGDFKPWPAEKIVRRAQNGLTPGAIIVMHDNALTVGKIAPLLDALLPKIKDAGYTFQRLP
jgi:peptidoglycan-N-acetylglucosamine deacetylase